MPITQGKNSRAFMANAGGAGSAGGSLVFPAPPSGTIYLVDWVNVLVRDGTAATAYIEISIVALEGATPVIINMPLVNSGVPTNLGTYGCFVQGLGIPTLADGSSISASVFVRDVTGAGSATTAVNGLIITAWGLKQYPYVGMIG